MKDHLPGSDLITNKSQAQLGRVGTVLPIPQEVTAEIPACQNPNPQALSTLGSSNLAAKSITSFTVRFMGTLTLRGSKVLGIIA